MQFSLGDLEQSRGAGTIKNRFLSKKRRKHHEEEKGFICSVDERRRKEKREGLSCFEDLGEREPSLAIMEKGEKGTKGNQSPSRRGS